MFGRVNAKNNVSFTKLVSRDFYEMYLIYRGTPLSRTAHSSHKHSLKVYKKVNQKNKLLRKR